MFSNLLHDRVVREFEENFAKYVGAKYACSANSASSLIYLAALRYQNMNIPSMIPSVVPNAIINAKSHFNFVDDLSLIHI